MAEYNFTFENTSRSADGSSASVFFYHSDRQFNVSGLTNLSGNIVELYSYTPYGKQTILTASGTEINESAYNNCYGYTGRYLDEETGLWYFRARYFDNELGRFISRDPLGFVDGHSLCNGYFADGFGLDPDGLEREDKPVNGIESEWIFDKFISVKLGAYSETYIDLCCESGWRWRICEIFQNYKQFVKIVTYIYQQAPISESKEIYKQEKFGKPYSYCKPTECTKGESALV